MECRAVEIRQVAEGHDLVIAEGLVIHARVDVMRDGDVDLRRLRPVGRMNDNSVRPPAGYRYAAPSGVLMASATPDLYRAPSRAVRFPGRVLFLTEDPTLLKRRIEGVDLEWSPALRLRCDISTDEIVLVYRMYHFDERLGEYPYERLRAGDQFPISPGAVEERGVRCARSPQAGGARMKPRARASRRVVCRDPAGDCRDLRADLPRATATTSVS